MNGFQQGSQDSQLDFVQEVCKKLLGRGGDRFISRMPLLRAMLANAEIMQPWRKPTSPTSSSSMRTDDVSWESIVHSAAIASYVLMASNREQIILRLESAVTTAANQTLQKLEDYLLRVIYDAVPNMRLIRVKSEAEEAAVFHSPQTSGDWAFCLSPRYFPKGRHHCFHPPDVDPTCVVFAPQHQLSVSSLDDHLNVTVAHDRANRCYMIYADSYVAASVINPQDWLAIVNHDWVISQAERHLEKAVQSL
jgi:hypothetical protein